MSAALLFRRSYSAKRTLPTIQQSIAAAKAGQGSPKEQHHKPQQPQYIPKFLDRPLGVDQKPFSRPLSNQEKVDLLLNQERRMNERKRLVREISKGYYSDLHDLRDHGGKLWVAPDTLIREDKSLYFPDFQGRSLSGDKNTHTCDLFANKVTLVTIGSNLIAEEHISSYKMPILSQYQDNPEFQLVQINLQESKMKYFVATMMMSNLKRSVPSKYHPTYLLVNSPMSLYEDSLNCKNRYVGYVFLVDWEGKVRWAGCGYAAGANIHKENNVNKNTPTSHQTSQKTESTGGEVESLARCIGVLIKRLNDSKSSSTPAS